ncbi:SOS response-associated peptidase [Pontibacter qinzhouensis]|uniref:Abasic site processing protein n=1 Tax=Pontibacter qinzhouensis TaxID=2603253 RepID=A0A5C8JER4_9BACT|nr:SOS response-associated peptidase family protein [Pontibacter qinzhouensis]TXK36850.1 SOS response-associated peptidase [Pontibacter qinzhouensis]
MCGRYSVNNKKVPKEHRFAALLEGLDFEPNFDARPSQQLPVILPDAPKAVLATWASPEKEPDGKPTLPFNVRQENLLFIPRFRVLLPRNRCIIPVDGFFEWKEVEPEEEEVTAETQAGVALDLFGNPILSKIERSRLKKMKPPKQKYRFNLKSEEPFGLAGLWREGLNRDTGELAPYFSIITTGANTAVAPYHDRMPVILTPESEQTWLNNRLQEKQWYNVLQPYDSRQMAVTAVKD